MVGNMGHPPNADGAVWLCREVLPLLRGARRDPVTVGLVGFDPPRRVRALAAIDGVEVAGGVADVGPWYGDCDIVVCPVRSGSGTRIKILEAMSYGRPVVTTTLGAEGVACAPDRDILVADGAEGFASACLRLAASPGERARIGSAGRALVERHYEASAVAHGLRAIVADLLGERAAVEAEPAR
jgi:glycosyltransferase involved in cell wall biosynthesis